MLNNGVTALPPKMQFSDDMQFPPEGGRWLIDHYSRTAHIVPIGTLIGDGTRSLCGKARSSGMDSILIQYSKFAYQPCQVCQDRSRRIHAGVKHEPI